MSGRGPKKPAWSLLLLLPFACGGEKPPPPDGYFVWEGMTAASGGETIFLRGINVREDAKYHPQHLLPVSDAQLVSLRESGFPAVRLLASWAALMPERGVIDQEYLGRLIEEAGRFSGMGFFVVLDMHQDLWGEPFGNGAPAWACPDELKAGYVPQDPWWANYFSDQVEACFDNFWNSAELRGLYADAWAALAEGACAIGNVAGFDLMNEPFPGSAFGQSGFDNEVLMPFYQELIEAITPACRDRLFFLEPSRAYDYGLSDALEIPLSLRSRVVLAPHFYPPAVHEPGAGYDGDRAALEQALVNLYGVFDSQKIPVWFGEFGGLTENPNYSQYLADMQEIFYGRLWSGALWAFSLGDGGFSFLDASGARKPAFDPFCAPPAPVRLPSRPAALSVQVDPPALDAEFACRGERRVEILLPGTGSWKVDYSPPGSLTTPQVDGQLLRCSCSGEIQVTLHLEKNP